MMLFVYKGSTSYQLVTSDLLVKVLRIPQNCIAARFRTKLNVLEKVNRLII